MKEKNPCTYVVEVLWAYLPLIYVCIDAAAELKKQWKGYEQTITRLNAPRFYHFVSG